MRAFFLLLVLANLGFFAWARYLSPADAATDPAPLARQIEPHKLKVVGRGEAVPPASSAAPKPEAVSTQPAQSACLEWGSFTLTDAPKAQRVLEALNPGARVTQHRTEETAGWWVYIAPQGSRQGALKKAAELKSLGVEEYFVVADEGPFRWGLSLGVFRNEQAALARLAALRDQGVRSAEVGARETIVPKVWLQVQGVDASTEVALRDAARQVEGSELRPCLAGEKTAG